MKKIVDLNFSPLFFPTVEFSEDIVKTKSKEEIDDLEDELNPIVLRSEVINNYAKTGFFPDNNDKIKLSGLPMYTFEISSITYNYAQNLEVYTMDLILVDIDLE